MANISVSTIVTPANAGAVSSTFDAASGIYMASVTSGSVISWAVKCEYCGDILATFGNNRNIQIDFNQYSGHPGPFTVTVYFANATLIGLIESRIYVSTQSGLYATTIKGDVRNHTATSVTLTVPATIETEDGIFEFQNWESVESVYTRDEILTTSGRNSTTMTYTIDPGFYVGDVNHLRAIVVATARYSNNAKLLYGSDGQLVYGSGGKLLYGVGKVLQSNGSVVPL